MSSHVNPGDILGGSFRIDAQLGEGAMGVVFRATNLGTGEPCAVKLILPHVAQRPGVLARFETEAKVGAKIGRSPYIVHVIFAGVDAERRLPFLVMELLSGETLAQHIARGPLDPALVRTLVNQLAEALDQAHEAGVVHRDLKPSNLYLTTDRRQRPVLKVLDFGIAKILEGELHATATDIGTPIFAAPEQLGPFLRKKAQKLGVVIADSVSPQTDLWPFGLVVFEMLTGRTTADYWEATTAADLALAQADALQERPRATERAGDRASSLPPGFDAWLARCLEIDATKRWSSAGEAATALLALYGEQRRSDRPAAQVLAAKPAPAASSEVVQTAIDIPAFHASARENANAARTATAPAARAPGLATTTSGLAASGPSGADASSFAARPAGKSRMPVIVLGVVALLGVAGLGVGLSATSPWSSIAAATSSSSAHAGETASAGTGQNPIVPTPLLSVASPPERKTAEPAPAPAPPLAVEVSDAAPAAEAQPGDDLLGTYSCTVGGTGYTCIIKRDAKGKLVLEKPCCSWTWYFYLSSVTASGFNGAGAAQVDQGWNAASGRGSFNRAGPDRITGRVHTINGDHGQYGAWDDDVVMVRTKK